MFQGKSLQELKEVVDAIAIDVEVLRESIVNFNTALEEEKNQACERQAKEQAQRHDASRHLYGIKTSLSETNNERLLKYLRQRRENITAEEFTKELLVIFSALDPMRFLELATAFPNAVATVPQLLTATDTLDLDLVETVAKGLDSWLDQEVVLPERGERLASLIAASVPSSQWLATLKQLKEKHHGGAEKVFTEALDLLSGLSLSLRIDKTSVQWLLRELDIQTLVVALSREPKQVVDRVISCMAFRAGEMVRDDMEYLGTPDPDELETARRTVVAAIRLVKNEGKILFSREEEEFDGDIADDDAETDDIVI